MAESKIPTNQTQLVLLGEVTFTSSSSLPVTINAPGLSSSSMILIVLALNYREAVTEVTLPMFTYVPMFVYESDTQKAYCVIKDVNTDTPSVYSFTSNSAAWQDTIYKTVRIYKVC